MKRKRYTPLKYVSFGSCSLSNPNPHFKDGRWLRAHVWSDEVNRILEYEVCLNRPHGGTYKHMFRWWQEKVVDELKGYHPSAVVLSSGTDEILAAESDPNPLMREYIEKMVNSTKENGFLFLIVNPPPFKGSTLWTEDRQLWLESFNLWLKDYAEKTKDFIYIDLYSLVIDPETGKTRDKLASGTRWCLSYLGMDVLGKVIAEYLNAYFMDYLKKEGLDQGLAFPLGGWPTPEYDV